MERRIRNAWLIIGLTLGIDQASKLFVVTSFAPGESVAVLGPLLHLTYVQNTGAAFGLLKGQQTLFIALTIGVIAWLMWELFLKRPEARGVVWDYALILGGALGNLLDRIRLGYVVDFIDLRVWPVFNIGDSAITIGVSWLLLRLVIRGRRRPHRAA